MATQALLTALMAALLELTIDPEAAARGTRFSILFLFLWTAVVAAILGGGRWLAARFGWTLENFFTWQYFLQLQVVGIANAALAIGLLASLRFPQDWPMRAIASAGALLIATAGTTIAMNVLFAKDVGAEPADLVWLMMLQGLFLLATLVPLELAANR
jgi:hypothetical protein